MAYEPKTWACGDTITADDLNHIEQGIAQSGGAETMVVNFDAYRATPSAEYEVTADKTFDEILEAHENGAVIILRLKEQTGNNPYSVYSEIADVNMTFNEQSQLVVSEFRTAKVISGYTRNIVEIGIYSNGNAYFSTFSG